MNACLSNIIFHKMNFIMKTRLNLTGQAKQIYANTPELKNVHLLWCMCVNIQS